MGGPQSWCPPVLGQEGKLASTAGPGQGPSSVQTAWAACCPGREGGQSCRWTDPEERPRVCDHRLQMWGRVRADDGVACSPNIGLSLDKKPRPLPHVAAAHLGWRVPVSAQLLSQRWSATNLGPRELAGKEAASGLALESCRDLTREAWAGGWRDPSLQEAEISLEPGV